MQNKIYQRRVKRLSSFVKKGSSVELPIEDEDFKVLNVQKIHSFKLDDHLNVEKIPNHQVKIEKKFTERRRSSNPETPSPKKDVNLFLEAKYRYMKSKSVKHSPQFDKSILFDQQHKCLDRKQQVTTYREQRRKDIINNFSYIKQLHAKIGINDALGSTATRSY